MYAIRSYYVVNGVAKKHGEVSQALFPGFEIHAITNGVHPFTWTSPYMMTLFDKYLPSWANEPELLVRVDNIPDAEIWDAHCGAKAYLFQYIYEVTGRITSYNVCYTKLLRWKEARNERSTPWT